MTHPHTWDGKQLTAGVSGFNNYSTERIEPLKKPGPALSLSDILNQINKLKKFCDSSKLEKALLTLDEHVNNLDNPHRVTLDMFTQDVADILYQEYKAQGGTGTLDSYLTALFRVLRVASLDEINTTEDYNLLISIRGAKRLIAQHEADPNAHRELIDSYFPGTPVTDEPVGYYPACLGASVANLRFVDVGDEVNLINYFNAFPDVFTIVDNSGTIVNYSPRDGIPTDYSQGYPAIPTFGPRTNFVKNSNDFSIYSTENLRLAQSDYLGPDGFTLAHDLIASVDEEEVEHNFVIPDFELQCRKPKCVSLYIKSGSCRYVSFRYFDMVTSEIEVFALFDLKVGACLSGNHLNRYGASIEKLTDGFYRCCFNMYHQIGQIDDLRMTFFNEKKDDVVNSYHYQSEQEEIVASVFGLQIEDGFDASPYIPTFGSAVFRPAIRYKVPVDGLNLDLCTLAISASNPGLHPASSNRPILSVVDEENKELLRVHYRGTANSIRTVRFSTIKVGEVDVDKLVYDETQTFTNASSVKYAYTYNPSGTITFLNGEVVSTEGGYNNNPDTPTYAYLGSDNLGNYFDGYIRNFSIYKRKSTDNELMFLSEEEV